MMKFGLKGGGNLKVDPFWVSGDFRYARSVDGEPPVDVGEKLFSKSPRVN